METRFSDLKKPRVGRWISMSIKLFILGRPGSGKSTAYRHIKQFVKDRYIGWTTSRYNDYDILYEMFKFEKLGLNGSKQKQFSAREYDGFDVNDFRVLDISLKQLEKRVRENISDKEELIIIEFARQDYCKALSLFSSSFLRDAYFLFINADTKICIQRVKNRVTDPPTPDNHFVSENILTEYYKKQIIPSIIRMNNGDPIDESKIKVINSRGTLQDFNMRVEKFITYIIASEDSLYEIPAISKSHAWSKFSRVYSQFSKKLSNSKEHVAVSPHR
jgi:nucleoside-triphosphatase THEP1